MKHSIEPLSRAGYRKFGLTTGAMLVGLFGLLIPWLFSLDYPRWPWLLAALLVTSALLAPRALRPVHTGWMKFGQVMNWINTRLILGVLFYGIFLPFGLGMRLLGKDPMHRKLDDRVSTYRVKSHNDSKDSVERPF